MDVSEAARKSDRRRICLDVYQESDGGDALHGRTDARHEASYPQHTKRGQSQRSEQACPSHLKQVCRIRKCDVTE